MEEPGEHEGRSGGGFAGPGWALACFDLRAFGRLAICIACEYFSLAQTSFLSVASSLGERPGPEPRHKGFLKPMKLVLCAERLSPSCRPFHRIPEEASVREPLHQQLLYLPRFLHTWLMQRLPRKPLLEPPLELIVCPGWEWPARLGRLSPVGALKRCTKDVQADLRGRGCSVALRRNLFSRSRAGGCNPTPGNLFAVSLPLVATSGHCSLPVNSADSLSICSDFP